MRRFGLGLALVAALIVCAPSSAKTTVCKGTFSPGTSANYQLRITKGSYDCAKGKRTLSAFITSGTKQAGFVCTRGHSADHWAATCAKGKTLIMRAYEITTKPVTSPGPVKCGGDFVIPDRHCTVVPPEPED